MNRYAFVLAAGLALTASSPSWSAPKAPSPAPAIPGPYGQAAEQYELAFSEEFNSFNTARWNDRMWYEDPNKTRNYTVEGGLLKVWPQRDRKGNFFNRTIDTDGKFYQTYGYFEVELKQPVGKGVWSGFWMLNHDLPSDPALRPEFDVTEAYAGAGPDSGWSDAALHPIAYSSTIWRNFDDRAGSVTVRPGVDLSAGFHKYGMKWEANRVTFYFDGVETYRQDVTMGNPMYLILNLWFGGPSGEPDSSTPTGKNNSLQVNYVRTWRFR